MLNNWKLNYRAYIDHVSTPDNMIMQEEIHTSKNIQEENKQV